MDHNETSSTVALDEPDGLPVHRVELFSDGVLGIAMTLLVLDLAVGEFETGNLSAALTHQRAAYVAFLISFVFIGVMWLACVERYSTRKKNSTTLTSGVVKRPRTMATG